MPWEGEREPRPVQYLESESRSKVEERSRLSGEQSFERASERTSAMDDDAAFQDRGVDAIVAEFDT